MLKRIFKINFKKVVFKCLSDIFLKCHLSNHLFSLLLFKFKPKQKIICVPTCTFFNINALAHTEIISYYFWLLESIMYALSVPTTLSFRTEIFIPPKAESKIAKPSNKYPSCFVQNHDSFLG